MTAFQRLGLLAGGIAYAVALLLVNRFLGFHAAVFAGVLAPIVAAATSLEFTPGPGPSDEVEKQEERDEFKIRQRDRTEIERSAARARDE